MKCERCAGAGRVACFAGSMRCPACDGRGRRPPTAEEWAEAATAAEAAMSQVLSRLAEIGRAMAEVLGPAFERAAAVLGRGEAK